MRVALFATCVDDAVLPRAAAEPLVLRMARVFEGYEYVVVPSGSCAAMVRDDYPRTGAKASAEGRGGELAESARALTPRVLELTEFVVEEQPGGHRPSWPPVRVRAAARSHSCPTTTSAHRARSGRRRARAPETGRRARAVRDHERSAAW